MKKTASIAVAIVFAVATAVGVAAPVSAAPAKCLGIYSSGIVCR